MNALIFVVLFILAAGSFVVGTQAITDRYDSLFQKYAKSEGVSDWKILKRIAMIESNLGLNPRVARGLLFPGDVEGSKSYDGKSWGLMQVTLETAKWLDASATVEKLNNAEFSIRLGAKYVAYLQKYFPKTDPRHAEWVVKSYNQGQGNTAKERAGTSPGYAQDYWAKYQKYSTQIA